MPPVFVEPFIDQDLINEKMLDLQDRMLMDQDFKFAMKAPKALTWDLQEKIESAMAQLDLSKPKLDAMAKMNFNFNFGDLAGPMAFAQNMSGSGKLRNNRDDDRVYQSGQGALDSHRWDEAVESFGAVAQHGGPRADGALYWKAFALNKLGKRDEALAAIAELRKSHAGSRWLDDAKALELEVQQAGGKPVSPDQVAEEDLKVLALQGLMQSDPDRAFPITQNLLKSSQSPKLKRMVIYLLAQNNSPKADQLLEPVSYTHLTLPTNREV